MIFGKFQVFNTKSLNLKDSEVDQEHAVLKGDLTRNIFSTSNYGLMSAGYTPYTLYDIKFG